MFTHIKKRDGRIVEFNSSKITSAIASAGRATGEYDEIEAHKLSLQVLYSINETPTGSVPGVEEIQDIVERILFSGYKALNR